MGRQCRNAHAQTQRKRAQTQSKVHCAISHNMASNKTSPPSHCAHHRQGRGSFKCCGVLLSSSTTGKYHSLFANLQNKSEFEYSNFEILYIFVLRCTNNKHLDATYSGWVLKYPSHCKLKLNPWYLYISGQKYTKTHIWNTQILICFEGLQTSWGVLRLFSTTKELQKTCNYPLLAEDGHNVTGMKSIVGYCCARLHNAPCPEFALVFSVFMHELSDIADPLNTNRGSCRYLSARTVLLALPDHDRTTWQCSEASC